MALTDSLVTYWKLDGNSNDSYRAKNGSDTDISYSASYGKIGQGASFDGDSSNINFGDDDIFSFVDKKFSISLWFKTDTGNFFPMFIAKGAPATHYEYSFGLNASFSLYFRCWKSNGSNIMQAIGGNVVNDNAWHHAVAVADGSKGYVYLDNMEDTGGGASFTGDMTAGTASLYMGTLFGASYFYGGYLDEVGIWKRALSPAEISLLYNSGSGRTYPFAPFSAMPTSFHV